MFQTYPEILDDQPEARHASSSPGIKIDFTVTTHFPSFHLPSLAHSLGSSLLQYETLSIGPQLKFIPAGSFGIPAQSRYILIKEPFCPPRPVLPPAKISPSSYNPDLSNMFKVFLFYSLFESVSGLIKRCFSKCFKPFSRLLNAEHQ